MILKAYRDQLVADSDVTANLATYDFGNGSEPAIFTVDPIPGDADHPAIVLTLVAGDDYGTRDTRGGVQDVDVRVYDDKTGSTSRIRNIAWAIYEALNRATLTISGYEAVGCVARPPGQAPDPDGYPGLLIPTTVTFLEE